ncbi:MAG: 3-dehydroquinate synthase [Phycisphaerae bacterium]|nr:3-dehydroquinate synthase [Phycisphaerae bacterium]
MMPQSTVATVNVATPGRGYRVSIGAGLLDRTADFWPAELGGRRAVIITDSQVGSLYATRLAASLVRIARGTDTITVPAGEASKSLERATTLYDEFAARRIGRDAVLVALGGGVVGDLAGFVASTWLRGLPLVQCPTTVEAAVDASVGGKTGLNMAAGKNLVGTFHQPAAVIIDVGTFSTLDARDRHAGLAESVKHALIDGDAFLDWHAQRATQLSMSDNAAWIELVRRNCEIKARVVEADERELGGRDGIGRAALNFGHTIGHALEACTQFGLRHGECVALGMIAALWIGDARGIVAAGLLDHVRSTLEAIGLPIRLDQRVDPADVVKFAAQDKKSRAGRLRFIMVQRPGALRWLDDVTEAEVRVAIDSIQSAGSTAT